MGYNKITYNKKVLIDLTNDTVSSDKLLYGVTAHDKSGELITGNFGKDYPPMVSFNDIVMDSSGNPVLDNLSSKIIGQINYLRM